VTVSHTSPAARAAADDTERPETPFPPALVEEVFRCVLKSLRAHQLYMHNNPTYLKTLDVSRAAFRAVWAQTEELVLEVTETELRWEQVPVVREPEKAGDSLPWILYKDGVRELRILHGFEQDELVPFLDILARVRRTAQDEDDLLTLLWEQEFTFVRYRYIDAVESAAPLERAGASGGEVLRDSHETPQAVPEMDATVPGVVKLEDFDTTLYFLDESEVTYLQEEVRKEYESDLRRNVVSILLDTFEVQTDSTCRMEICSDLDGLLLHFLSAGHFRAVAYLLREGQVTSQRARDVTAQQQQALLALPNRLSEPEVLSQVLQQLDESPELPAQEELNELFEQFRPTALGTAFAWLRRLQTPRLRTLLENAAARLAAQNSAELVKLIQAPDRDVALEAIRRAGALKATAAVAPLARVATDPDVPTRLAAVQALGEIGSPGAMQILERTIEDAHRDIRVATARAFGARQHRAGLPKLEAAIKGKVLRDSDLTEKMAIFEAYGSLCGDGGVQILDGILNARGLFSRKEEPEFRACSAMALGRIGTEKALETLRRASNEKEVLVRNAVNRALRGGLS
jgi:HEAT repeat protein